MIYVRIADTNFCLICKYRFTELLCKDYIIPAVKDAIDISVCESEIQRENTTGNFPPNYLESLAILRKISDYMLTQDTLLFHASVVAVDDKAYAFTALSGTGKSTHTKLWRKLLGERAVMVNDDKPFVRISGTKAVAYGSPWNGKHKLSNNIAVPLTAVCLLNRGQTNTISEITARSAYPTLLQQSYRPDNSALIPIWMRLTESLANSVNLYTMNCNMELSAAKTAFDFMNRKEM